MNFPRSPSRAARWSILVALFAIGLGGVLAKIVASRAGKIAPAAYLVALENDTQVRLRWKTRRLATALTLPANAVVSIPQDKKVLVVYPDGRQETVAGPQRIQIPTPAPSELEFLALSLNALAAKPPESETAPSGPIRVTSPVGITRFLNPTLSWTTSEGTWYDVAIIDPADPAIPPRVAQSVRPPLRVSALESKQGPTLPRDRILAVLVRVKGEVEIGGTNRFLTAQDATNEELPTQPAALLAEAVSALAHKPFRTGDAWLALSHLPEPWQHCELALRLRLRVSTELGLDDEVKKLTAEMGTE